MKFSTDAIKVWLSFTFDCCRWWLKISLADCKLIRSVSDIILETKLRRRFGREQARICNRFALVEFLIGTKSHFTNWFFVRRRNKMTRPNEKMSDFFSFFSKHSGLANIGVPPFESESAIPKSVKTISICAKSVGPFLNLIKKFCGFISLCVWLWKSKVSRLF